MEALQKELFDFLEHYKTEIRQAAEELSGKPLPALTEDLFALFESTGNRLRYEEVYFGRRKFLAVFGMKALLERQENGRALPGTLAKLSETIEEICGEECWALPAHVNRAENPNWRVTVDLFASETAQTLSDIGDTLNRELPGSVRQQIAEQVERRVLKPFFESEIPYQPWEHVHTNWNAVCAGSIGSACLHLLRGQPDRLRACLDRILRALPYYAAGFAEDGTCVEGLSYFTYGMTYFVNFALELYDYTVGRTDILRGAWNGFAAGGGDKRARMAVFQQKCYFSDGRTLSFSDGDSRDKFRAGLSCALAARFPGVKLPNPARAAGLHDDTCYRFAALKMDLLETSRFLKGLASEKENGSRPGSRRLYVLSDAQWCVMESDNGVGMACKGGHNDEPHNHNDVGCFIFEAAGEFFLTDLGAGEYTRDYFSSGRYRIFCNRSLSHSVPIVCGRGQQAGAEYRCKAFEAGEKGSVRMELAGAYGVEALERLTRELSFSLETGMLTVRDEFVFRVAEDTTGAGEQARAVENLVTQIMPQVKEGVIILCGRGGSCVIEPAAELAGCVTIQEHTHSNHRGEPEAVYTISWPVRENTGVARACFRISWIQGEVLVPPAVSGGISLRKT